MMKHSNRNLSILEARLGTRFRDIQKLEHALTHSSYANRDQKALIPSNERLEFLGDSILSMVISEYLFLRDTSLQEGDLTRYRALIVCAGTLAMIARQLELSEWIILGRSEQLSGGAQRESILADVLEAIIGAVYLDTGLEAAQAFILTHFKDIIILVLQGDYQRDYKTLLQELVQRRDERAEYEIVREEGPAHRRIFVACVKVRQNVYGCGRGKTKKEAEQSAAAEAYQSLKNNY